MTIEETKSIDIVSYMQKMGINGTDKGRYVWYCSPFRDEKTASFSVDTLKNRWVDFGSGERGDLIDLIKLIFGIDTTEALSKLSDNKIDQYVSFYKATKDIKVCEPGIKINKIGSLNSYVLIDYLNKRGINSKLSLCYCREVTYTVREKQYYAIGFKNDAGGWELRNKYFKGHNVNSITTINKIGSTELNITEGFIDFLSALQYYGAMAPKHTTIVLNSTSNLKSVYPILNNYSTINLYMDNDPESETGQKAAEEISKLHPNVINHAAIIYPEFKDFNDFLMNKKL